METREIRGERIAGEGRMRNDLEREEYDGERENGEDFIGDERY